MSWDGSIQLRSFLDLRQELELLDQEISGTVTIAKIKEESGGTLKSDHMTML